jgi:hypothetical protein
MQSEAKEINMCFCDPFTPARGTYAGIGSRATPHDVLELMTRLAAKLASENWTLRTGGAAGADQAFFDGAISVRGCAEVYLPWPGYNDHTECRLARPSQRAYEIAANHHPAWSVCSSGAKALHARNCHQILGDLLEQPVNFVLCYTPDGSLTGKSRTSGGTGQALRIATSAEVPVFNLQRSDHRKRIEDWITA